MTESNTRKFDDFNKLLSQHSFKVDKNIPDKLKCERCKKLLIDPCQGPCLCKFCRNCIDTMIRIGIDKCPGNKVECKNEQLSNFLSHYETNSKISKLVLKCPEQMCSHKCELMKMEEHLNMCSKKIFECPFYSLGCIEDRLANDKMSDHLHLDGYKHNKILMEYLRKELSVLKQSDEKNKEEIQRNIDRIEVLVENSRIKDRTIAAMSEEIRRNNLHIEASKENSPVQIETIKMMLEEIQNNKDQIKVLMENSKNKDRTIEMMGEEIRNNKHQIDMFKENSPVQIDTITVMLDEIQENKNQLTERLMENSKRKDEKIAEMQEEIIMMKVEKQEIAAKLNNLKTESDIQINNSKEEITEVNRNNLVREMSKINDEILQLQTQTTEKINALNNWLGIQHEKSFRWQVDQISDKRVMSTDICSPIFYPRINPYKMQLKMHNCFNKDEFEIWFVIHCGDKDQDLVWPFESNATIKIVNHINPDVCKTITKSCYIKKPATNNCSDKFKFSYRELASMELMQDDSFIVEHCIE